MYDELINIVQNLGSPKVLLAGDFLLDIYVYGDALRISPEAPVPVLKVVSREYRPGGAASVAADLSALGAKIICLGAVGKDTNAQTLKMLLQGVGADISGMVEVLDRPTITKEYNGGTKKKSKRTTLRNDAIIESRRPNRKPTHVTPRK